MLPPPPGTIELIDGKSLLFTVVFCLFICFPEVYLVKYSLMKVKILSHYGRRGAWQTVTVVRAQGRTENATCSRTRLQGGRQGVLASSGWLSLDI